MMRILLAVLVCVAAGCGGDADGDRWQRLGESLTAEQSAQRDRAYDARDAMFGALMKRLKASLQSGGAANSIDVCRTDAPSIGADIEKQAGVRIGRTSFKLRNPKNVPPAWAVPYVEARTEEPVQLAHADGRFAALLPIRLMPPCIKCHGAGNEVTSQVREALAEYYPEDQATGFKSGDLRGWFWIEVPAP